MSLEKPSGASRLTSGIGWFAVALSLIGACALAGWGTEQALFRGWWATSVLENLWMTAVGLLPAAIVVVIALLAIARPGIGGLLQAVAGILVFLLPVLCDAGFRSNPNYPHLPVLVQIHLTGIVLAIVGFAYLKGRPQPRWLAMGLLIVLPIVTSFICAVEPAWRIYRRADDGIMAARRVQGNGVELVWAPAGPGWPEHGTGSLCEAERIASNLTEDGLSLADSPQNIWRLPTIDEVVRSLTRNGENAGGVWDPDSGHAKYRVTPDKESPLWRVHSPVVYWWTSSRASPDDIVIYIISYRGGELRHYTIGSRADVGFRAVKER